MASVSSSLRRPALVTGRLDVASEKTRVKIARPKAKSVAVALQSMAVMLDAGVPLAQVLAAVHSQTADPELAVVLHDLEARVARAGWRLSQAMRCHPEVFPAYSVMLVQAAELGGDLAGRVQEAGDLMERQLEMRARVRSALFSPFLTLITATLIMFACVKFVMPRFVELYAGMDVALPWVTKVVIAIVDGVNNPVFLTVVALWSGGIWWFRRRLFQEAMEALLRFDPFRRWIGTLLAAQFCDLLSSLIGQGVPMLHAVKMIADNSSLRTHRANLLSLHRKLSEEGDLPQALAEVPYFPKLVTTVAVVGDEVGTQEQMMSSLSRILQHDVDVSIHSAVRLLEPAMICGMGTVGCFFFVGIFWPIYGMIQNLH